MWKEELIGKREGAMRGLRSLVLLALPLLIRSAGALGGLEGAPAETGPRGGLLRRRDELRDAVSRRAVRAQARRGKASSGTVL